MGVAGAAIALGVLFIAILILRLLGAWMLRINEVITNQQTQIELLSKLLDKQDQKTIDNGSLDQ